MTIEEFELKHMIRVQLRIMGMVDGGKDIHNLLKDSSEVLKVSKVAPTWKAYVDFVNNIALKDSLPRSQFPCRSSAGSWTRL